MDWLKWSAEVSKEGRLYKAQPYSQALPRLVIAYATREAAEHGFEHLNRFVREEMGAAHNYPPLLSHTTAKGDTEYLITIPLSYVERQLGQQRASEWIATLETGRLDLGEAVYEGMLQPPYVNMAAEIMLPEEYEPITTKTSHPAGDREWFTISQEDSPAMQKLESEVREEYGNEPEAVETGMIERLLELSWTTLVCFHYEGLSPEFMVTVRNRLVRDGAVIARQDYESWDGTPDPHTLREVKISLEEFEALAQKYPQSYKRKNIAHLEELEQIRKDQGWDGLLSK